MGHVYPALSARSLAVARVARDAFLVHDVCHGVDDPGVAAIVIENIGEPAT